MPRRRRADHRQYLMPLCSPWELSSLTAGGGTSHAMSVQLVPSAGPNIQAIQEIPENRSRLVFPKLPEVTSHRKE